MVQFNLPQNSKIEVGKYYKDITNSNNLKKINVYKLEKNISSITHQLKIGKVAFFYTFAENIVL